MTENKNKEIEVKFLEVDKEEIIKKSLALGAIDHGESMVDEIIFKTKENFDNNGSYLVRLRKLEKGRITLSYKHRKERLTDRLNDVEEIEIEVLDFDNTKLFLEKTGFFAVRYQQKIRHTLTLDNVTIDIDTWPRIPTFVELESDSEESLKKMAAKLVLDWSNVKFVGAGSIIEDYGIEVTKLKYYTFTRFE